jgi:hypothetical protein
MGYQEGGSDQSLILMRSPEVREVNALRSGAALEGGRRGHRGAKDRGKRGCSVIGTGLAAQQLRGGAVTSAKESSKRHMMSVTGKPSEP